MESYSKVVRFVGTLEHQGLILVSEGDPILHLPALSLESSAADAA